MTTPTLLPAVAGSYQGNYDYRLRQTTSTHAIYDGWVTNQSRWIGATHTNLSIKVGIDANASDYNTWSDNGSSDPATVVVAGNNIQLLNGSNGLIYEFVKPTTASWISSGTTGTEGFSYSGTLTVNGTSLEYEIPATSSSGTYELKADDTTQLSIVHGSSASTGSAPNFDQTKIWTLISPMGDELDEIDLTGSGGSSTKKVFCNFW